MIGETNDELREEDIQKVISAVLKEVVHDFKVSEERLKGRERREYVVVARQVLLGLLYYFGMTPSEISRYMGKSWTAIVYNLKSIGVYKESKHSKEVTPHITHVLHSITNIAYRLSYLHTQVYLKTLNNGITLQEARQDIQQYLTVLNAPVAPIISYVNSLFRADVTSIMFYRYHAGLSFLAQNAPIREQIIGILLQVEDRAYDKIIQTAAEAHHCVFVALPEEED